MAEKKLTTVALVNTYPEIFEKGESLGLSGSFILELLVTFGAELVLLLFAMLKDRPQPLICDKALAFGAPGAGYLFDWKRLLAILLARHKEEILAQLDKLEEAVLDGIIAYLNQ